MPGIAPKLPLQTSPADGYALTKTLKETMKQNFKMLVLTAPGERMMDPEYGVGLRNYLFDQNVTTTRSSLSSAIENQVQTYMPFLRIGNISFPESENPNMLHVRIQYSIPNIGARDVLDLNVSTGY